MIAQRAALSATLDAENGQPTAFIGILLDLCSFITLQPAGLWGIARRERLLPYELGRVGGRRASESTILTVTNGPCDHCAQKHCAITRALFLL